MAKGDTSKFWKKPWPKVNVGGLLDRQRTSAARERGTMPAPVEPEHLAKLPV
jgi:hypothetical protein